MQFVALAFIGCCVMAQSASLSEPLTDLSSGTIKASGMVPEIEILMENGRTKRSGGSGGFFAGIGNAILGKVAGASSSLSSGSRGHDYETVEYGPPVHTYEENNFDVWSFKKAILNTLLQALKAIGGGVIALKGHLIKGGGVIISTKGKIISAKGEAISTLGRHIASSAILAPPKQSPGYLYEAPVHIPSGGHNVYDGPPPSLYSVHGGYAASSDGYEKTAYAAPSDDAAHPGLLIIKSMKPDDVQPDYAESHLPLNSGIIQKNPLLDTLVNNINTKKALGTQRLINKLSDFLKSKSPAGPAEAPTISGYKEVHPETSYGSQVYEDVRVGDSHATHIVHDERKLGLELQEPIVKGPVLISNYAQPQFGGLGSPPISIYDSAFPGQDQLSQDHSGSIYSGQIHSKNSGLFFNGYGVAKRESPLAYIPKNSQIYKA